MLRTPFTLSAGRQPNRTGHLTCATWRTCCCTGLQTEHTHQATCGFLGFRRTPLVGHDNCAVSPRVSYQPAVRTHCEFIFRVARISRVTLNPYHDVLIGIHHVNGVHAEEETVWGLVFHPLHEILRLLTREEFTAHLVNTINPTSPVVMKEGLPETRTDLERIVQVLRRDKQSESRR